MHAAVVLEEVIDGIERAAWPPARQNQVGANGFDRPLLRLHGGAVQSVRFGEVRPTHVDAPSATLVPFGHEAAVIRLDHPILGGAGNASQILAQLGHGQQFRIRGIATDHDEVSRLAAARELRHRCGIGRSGCMAERLQMKQQQGDEEKKRVFHVGSVFLMTV